MAKIKSDLGTQTFTSRSGMRTVEVPDEEEGHTHAYESSDDGFTMEAINERLRARGMPPIDENAYKAFQAQAMQAQAERPVRQNPMPQQQSFSELEHQLSEAKRLKAHGRQRLSDAAKKRIELLCGIAKNSREFEMDGNSYVVRTLKNKEFREALMAASVFDGTVELPFETRKQILARALVQVAGTDIELFLGDSSLEAKLEFIDECDDRMLNKFYNEYLLLVEEVNKKYALNTEADAKEVAADIKK